jgi:hypothetical protein
MAKRIHTLNAKPGQLRAGWARPGPREMPDLCYAWGGEGAAKSEGRLLSEALEGNTVFEGRSLREELERRGYDIKTLKFSIEKKSS